MRIVTITIFMALLAVTSALAQYPVVPIDSIQWVGVGGDSSRYVGDTVITGGLVVAGTGIYYAGGGVSFYMENPNGGDFSGIMAYNPQREGFPELIPGDSILCAALVSEYGWNGPPFCTMTELFIVPGTFQYRMYGMPQPDPMVVTASVIDSTNNADSLGERTEGVFTKVYGLTVDTVINYQTTSTWICHDSTGLVFVREASDSIPNSFRPPAGTQFDFVQGVVYHRFGAYHLQPRYMRDIRLASGAPIVSSWHRPQFPLLNDLVTLTANVVDDSHVEEVRLYYRINLGGWNSVPMDSAGNDIYTFQLPSPQANWDVDYYITATDDSGNVTNDPYEAPASFYSYRVQQPRTMTIAEARADNNADFIPDLKDTAVVITGIAVSPNFQTDRTDFFMQQGSAGIDVYFDSTQIAVSPGDSVTANGIVSQYNGKTQLIVYRGSRITVHGPGHLPDTTEITCYNLTDIVGEALEGTLVRINNVEILEYPDPWPQLGWSATMSLTEGGADTVDMRIDRSTDIDGQPQQYPRASIVGVVGQYDTRDPYLGYYQLMPRYYSDFQWVTAVEDGILTPGEFSLDQNYPNPFNPVTNIAFTLKEKTHVKLSIYNLIGQRVNTLVDQDYGPGQHTLTWDGVDSKGEKVTSGIYFYRLDAGDYSATRKMLLVK